MDGLESVEILLSDVLKNNCTQRIDGEYFKKEYLKNEAVLKSDKTFTELQIKVSGGKRLPEGGGFSDSGVPYVRAEDVKKGFVDYNNSPFVSNDIFEILKRYVIENDDIAVTIVGNSIGDVAISKNKETICLLTENCAKVKSTDTIKAGYLYAFLASKYGQNQIMREKVGTAQPKLSLERIRTFKIRELSSGFQEFIQSVVQNSWDIFEKSRTSYLDANKMFECVLNINLDSYSSIAYKSLKKSLDMFGRLDAEYYHPKYEKYIEELAKFETTCIPDEFDMLKNAGTNYAEGVSDVGVIKTKQLTNTGVNTDGIESYFTNETCAQNKSTFIANNDVIFASMGVGSLGKVGLFSYDGDKMFVTDSTLRIYRAKETTRVLPEVLCIFLQSVTGQELIYRYVVGSTGIINIYDDDIAKIPIPVLDTEIQKGIAEKVQESFALRRQSKQLLEYAKRAVEIAIEEDEDVALKWLRNKTSQMEV